MTTCQICRHEYGELKFNSAHIAICGRCTNSLNKSPEPAEFAEERLAEMLARGMHKNALIDLESPEEWVRRKARRRLGDMTSAVAAELPRWLNRLLAKDTNSTRDFKIIRAERRGLLRMRGPAVLALPRNWQDVRQRILKRDDYQCKACRGADRTLDVHHIVHRAHFGTNQQANLITLCRACHQKEHPGIDLGSCSWVGPSSTPPQPPAIPPPPMAPASAPPARTTETRTELSCPGCKSCLSAALQKTKRQRVRCPICLLIFVHEPSSNPHEQGAPSPPAIPRVTPEGTHRQHAEFAKIRASPAKRLIWVTAIFIGSVILFSAFGGAAEVLCLSLFLALVVFLLTK